MALTLQQALRSDLAEHDFRNVTPQIVYVGKVKLAIWAVSGPQVPSDVIMGLAWPRRASAADYPFVIEADPEDLVWRGTARIPEWVTRWLIMHGSRITFGEELARSHLGAQVTPLD